MLGTHIETIPKYYIISAKDGVIAEEFQISDRLAWYLIEKLFASMGNQPAFSDTDKD